MSDPLTLFDPLDAPLGLSDPDEVIETEDYTISIYRPETYFKRWLRRVDETLMDMTGYCLHDFATMPTYGGWQQWPDHPYDAALAVLRNDVWGQAFLGDLDLE